MDLGALKTKLPMMGASLAFSFVLWIFVQLGQPRGGQLFPVLEVVPINMPAHYTAPEVIGTVMARAVGPVERLRTVDQLLARKQIFALVDLSDARPGRRRYPLRLQAPRDLQLTFSLAQSDVVVELDEMKKRDMPVVIETQGELPEGSGLKYEGASASPSKASIEGPQSAVERVTKVRTVLDLAQAEPGGSFVGVLEALGTGDRTIPDVAVVPLTVQVRANFDRSPEIKTVRIRPDFEGALAGGLRLKSWSVSPERVSVHGPASLLADLQTVATEPIQLASLSSSGKREIGLSMPKGLRSFTAKRVQVSFEIEAAATGSGR